MPGTLYTGIGEVRACGIMGKEYIDFAGGIAVVRWAMRIRNRVRALNRNRRTEFGIPATVTTTSGTATGEKLIDATFADRVFFCNSGAEANERR